MKEIALIGANGPVMSAVLTSLLERELSVNALTLFPEKVMLDNTRLTISRFDVTNEEAVREALEGYSTLVIANESNLENEAMDDLVLKYFQKTVEAAAKAGITRILVVGGKMSNAFYLSKLKATNLDWVYFDTEGDFAKYVADEVVAPRFHKENASF